MIGSKDQYALITGASSGIGYEMAKLFANDGKNIVVVARNKGQLEALKTDIEKEYGTNVMVLAKDLSYPRVPQEIFSELERKNVSVDALVNNAGFGIYGKFYETDLQKELEMIQVNITSTLHLTKLFLRKMRENTDGWVLNVASTAAFVPVPLHSAYAASKSFVLNFSQALASEMQGTRVSVTCLCPGPTDTPFWEKGNMEKGKTANVKMMHAADVADAGYKALKTRKVIVIPGLRYRWWTLLLRIIPESIATGLVSRLRNLRRSRKV
jgi:short-subunit dehydrogenase